jgi:hypothetical protein
LTSEEHVATVEAEEEEKRKHEAEKEARKKAREERSAAKKDGKGKGKGKGKRSLPPQMETNEDSSKRDEVSKSLDNTPPKRPIRRTAKESLALIDSILNRVKADRLVEDSDESGNGDDTDDELCGRCSLRDPEGTDEETEWIACEFCQVWYHRLCVDMHSTESVYICSECKEM